MRRLIIASLVLLVGWELLAWLGANLLVVKSNLDRAEAIVVLSGSTAYAERARWAATLFHEGRATRIILTNDNERGGWSQAEERNIPFVERAVTELKNAGVPAAKIEVVAEVVSGTYSEAEVLRRYALAHGTRSLLVVTSPYHARRARWTLDHVFKDSNVVLGMSPVPVSSATPSPAFWWLSPRGWRDVAGEYVKLLYYRFRWA